MKSSRYNYFKNYKDRIICLNGISGKTFSMNKEEFSILAKILHEKDKQIEKSSFTEWLLENRFLVNSDFDELNYLRELNKKSRESNYYNLILNPTMECNFNCWYCYEKHDKGYMSTDVLNRIKSHVNIILKKQYHKCFYLSWFGGEPLLYSKKIIYPLSLYIKEKCQLENVVFHNSITTNGFLINKKMITNFNEIDLRHFQITLDGKKATHDQIRNQRGEPSFDRIIQNCIDICHMLPNSTILLRINYTNESITEQFQDVLSVIPFDYRKQITVQFQRVWQTYSSCKQNEDIKNLLKKNESELRKNGFIVSYNHHFFIFKGHVCYADRQNYANINYNGNVYRCTARDYSSENALGYLNEKGEIIWKENRLHNIDSKPYFDNEKCLKCKYLPLCGGPCFQKALSAINDSKNFCTKDIVDSDIETFIIQHYIKVKEHNEFLKSNTF
jgi:uncharacterized protein